MAASADRPSSNEATNTAPVSVSHCSVGVKNLGGTAGLPTVYALYRYSDGGSSGDATDNGNCTASDPIPPGTLGFVYFCHSYNPQQHNVIQAPVGLSNISSSYRNVRVASPNPPRGRERRV